jgi:flagella basal body P-ring formation protein FlgA
MTRVAIFLAGLVAVAAAANEPPPKPAVARGETLEIVFRRGSVSVSSLGRAVTSGEIGDSVTVMRDGGLKAVRGTVRAPGLVELGSAR